MFSVKFSRPNLPKQKISQMGHFTEVIELMKISCMQYARR